MRMQNMRILAVCLAFVCLTGCVVGEISNGIFYLEDDFSVHLLDDDWQVIRQTRAPLNPNVVYSRDEIAFEHKKSNGFISVNSFALSDIDQSRTLSIHADAAVASARGMKLSEKQTKIDGIDAVEVIISGARMVKWVFMKKGEKGYRLMYSNTPAYFDQYLGVFDKFVETFKTL
jgi:hypothetical protein